MCKRQMMPSAAVWHSYTKLCKSLQNSGKRPDRLTLDWTRHTHTIETVPKKMCVCVETINKQKQPTDKVAIKRQATHICWTLNEFAQLKGSN